jgi:hypothetical protein
MINIHGKSIYSSSKTGIVDVFIIEAESDADGRAISSELPAGYNQVQEGIKIYYSFTGDSATDGSWQDLWPVHNTAKPATNGTVINFFGPETGLGYKAYNTYGINPYIIKTAVGGTKLAYSASIGNWNVASIGGGFSLIDRAFNYYINPALMSLANLNIRYRIWEIFIHGKNDAVLLADANAYEQNLTDYVDRRRLDLGLPNLPFIICLPSGDYSGTSSVYMSTIRQAMLNVADNMSDIHILECQDEPVNPSDPIHYSGAGLISIGHRLADLIQTLI